MDETLAHAGADGGRFLVGEEACRVRVAWQASTVVALAGAVVVDARRPR